MALFNHVVQYEQYRELDHGISGLIVRLEYNDAFGERKNISLGFPSEVDHVLIGGTATTNPLMHTGLVVGFDNNRSHVYVKVSDGVIYECVYSMDEDLSVNDPIMVVEHLNHADNDLSEFDWLATTRAADFQLNSIRVSARDSDGNELSYLNIDPYTGFINFCGMGI